MLKLKSWAKVNLCLEVHGKREDGYHALNTIYQTISLADEVRLAWQPNRITLSCSMPGVPTDASNLAFKAAALLAPLAPGQGVHIELVKTIPAQGGLGGGSSNAAAVLAGLNHLWRLNLSRTELAQLAASLGSDVPFFLWGGTALGTGRGEHIEPLAVHVDASLAVVVPPFGLSTPLVYGNYRQQADAAKGACSRLVETLAARQELNNQMLYNDLQEAAFSLRPELASLYRALAGSGLPILLSGSGSSLFALLPQGGDYSVLSRAVPTDYRIFFARTVNANSPLL